MTSTRDESTAKPQNENNVTEDEIRTRTATSRDTLTTRDENDVNDYAANDEKRSETERPNTATSRDNRNFTDAPTHLPIENYDDVRNSPNRGEDNSVPGISDNGKNTENENETSSPRGGKYNLRPNPTPNYTDEYRY